MIEVQLHFWEYVWESYKKYSKQKKSINSGRNIDVRLAKDAAIALYHFREHLPMSIQPSEKELIEACCDYKLLKDVANASKHSVITKGNPLVISSKNIYELYEVTQYKDKLGEYSHVEKKVMVRLKDGTERELFEVLTNVINFWFNWLYEAHLIENKKTITIKKKKIYPRSKWNKDGMTNLSISAIRGFPSGQKTFRLNKYNYETNQIEAINLTGSEVAMKIYKPLYDWSIQLALKGQPEIYLPTVKIDDIQKRELEKLRTNDDRIRFYILIAQQQGQIKIEEKNGKLIIISNDKAATQHK